MTPDEIHRFAVAVLAAAVRGDEDGLIAMTADLELSDAREVARQAARLFGWTMHGFARESGASIEVLVAEMENILLSYAANGEPM